KGRRCGRRVATPQAAALVGDDRRENLYVDPIGGGSHHPQPPATGRPTTHPRAASAAHTERSDADRNGPHGRAPERGRVNRPYVFGATTARRDNAAPGQGLPGRSFGYSPVGRGPSATRPPGGGSNPGRPRLTPESGPTAPAAIGRVEPVPLTAAVVVPPEVEGTPWLLSRWKSCWPPSSS